MTREEKAVIINNIAGKLASASYVYLVDVSGLAVKTTNKLRGLCFERGVEMLTVKNTLLQKAMERTNDAYAPIFDVLSGATTILIADTGNLPAKLIKEFRKANNQKKPLLKGAYIDSAVFVGEEMLDTLVSLKSKDELVGEVIGILQSPAKNVISALTSGGSKLAGILKTLEER